MTDFKELSRLFDRPIAYHRAFITLGAGVSGAVLLSQLWYWSARTNDPAGWIYKTQDEWQEETGLSPDEQRTARKHLVASGVLEEERRGIPARLYYRINVDKLLESLGVNIKILPLPISGSGDCPQQEVADANIFNKNTETTPETTPENTNIVKPVSNSTQTEAFPRPAEREQGRIMKALQGSQPIMDYSGLNVLDLRGYPEGVREMVGRVCTLWKLRAPTGKAKAYWIETARDLGEACADQGLGVLDKLFEEYDKYMGSHNGLPPYVVEGPGSLVKMARAMAGRLRGSPEGAGGVIDAGGWFDRPGK